MKQNLVFLVFILVFLIFALNFFQEEVRDFFYFSSSPVQKFLWKTGGNISGFFQAITEKVDLQKELEMLKLENLRLLSEISSLKELELENAVLREALNIELQKEFGSLLLAEVTGGLSFPDTLLLNKGAKDGVKIGDVVISQQKVLYGQINKVFENFSVVYLISHPESSFNVKIGDKDVFGTLVGQGEGKVILDLIPREKEIKEGDLILSSSLAGSYPKGLLIGFVSKVKEADVEPFKKAEVEAFFKKEGLEYLFIITDF